MEKPVIILSDGVVGNILAWRLMRELPHVPFKLYSSNFDKKFIFDRLDDERGIRLFNPFFLKSWSKQRVLFPRFKKIVSGQFHIFDLEKLNNVLSQELKSNFIQTEEIPQIEDALSISSFVIDTRDNGYFDKKGYQKSYTLEVELFDHHQMNFPVLEDTGKRRLECYPTGVKSLIIREIRYSKIKDIDFTSMKVAMSKEFSRNGWKVKSLLSENTTCRMVTLSSPVHREEGKVINFIDTLDSTDHSLAEIMKVTDKIIQSSFRFGEIQAVLKDYKQKMKAHYEFKKKLYGLLVEQNPHVLKSIFIHPEQVIKRFFHNETNFLDRARILMGMTHSQILNVFNVIPTPSNNPHLRFPWRGRV